MLCVQKSIEMCQLSNNENGRLGLPVSGMAEGFVIFMTLLLFIMVR